MSAHRAWLEIAAGHDGFYWEWVVYSVVKLWGARMKFWLVAYR
jgi:hypothetical protein